MYIHNLEIYKNPDNWWLMTTWPYTFRGKKQIDKFCVRFNPKGDYDAGSKNFKFIECPYGGIGDLLWVRETMIKNDGYTYWPVADGYTKNTPLDKTIPSIYMPKSVCRIWLQIKNIRVERLHSITEADIKAEGVKVLVSENNKPVFRLGKDNGAIKFMPQTWWKDATTDTDYDYFFAYWAELWCKINGRPNWDLNPWLWVIEFKRVEKPI